MKNILSALPLLAVLFLTGCATHANIKMPAVAPVNNAAFSHKSFDYNILYSQPEPGVFSGGDQQQLKPLDEAKVSVGAARTLVNLPMYIFEQLPVTATRAEAGQGDYTLMVKLIAHNKKGPAYGDFKLGASMAKGLVTLGMGSDEYAIVADFDVTYALRQGDTLVYRNSYSVDDHVAHQRGLFDIKNNISEYTGQLLEKHLILTLNDFFGKAGHQAEAAQAL